MSHAINHTSKSNGIDLDAIIDHIAHWLPSQGPIKDFIHHNTLHAVQDHPFHEGVAVAAKVFGARSYLPLADYLQRYREGRINDRALDWAIAQAGCSAEEERTLRSELFDPDHHSHYPPQSLANHGIRSAWLNRLEIDLNALVHPVIFRLLSNFLDQGISRWALPKPGESFWDCVLRLVQNSLLPLYPFHQSVVREMLNEGPEQVILNCLDRIVGDESLYAQYLLEVLLAHPGWSGMVHIIETQPQALLAPRSISLKQLLAVELACELAFVDKKRGHSFTKIAQLPNSHAIPLLERDTVKPHVPLKMRVWHEAMEWSLHSELLEALRSQPSSTLPAAHPPKVQALFCIDDRECSLRRYLEEQDPDIETFGAPGFFGIDFLYQGLEDVYPVAQCPVVIKPKHLILESNGNAKAEKKTNGESLSTLHFGAHSMFRGWLYTQTLGLAYALRLGWSVLRPGGQLPGIQSLSEVDAHGHLHLLRESDQPTEDGYLLGFSLTEMADRIGGLLCNIGLTKGFAPLVVVVAHGSSSVNNPHFAAYDCGACSGKPGAPNARAFAWMANHPSVREILRERGIDIPDTTHFVPAMHNTSRDEMSYFDQKDLDKSTRSALHGFQHAMQHALQRNARERCRWFELGPDSPDNEAAHDHVMARASSIFEPRPELNHSNN
ncbi:MAG: putative inorganic carbon transporter subunit DabA, partial [Methylomonas sp.]